MSVNNDIENWLTMVLVQLSDGTNLKPMISKLNKLFMVSIGLRNTDYLSIISVHDAMEKKGFRNITMQFWAKSDKYFNVRIMAEYI